MLHTNKSMHRVAAESYSENPNPSKRATPKGRERGGVRGRGGGGGGVHEVFSKR